MLFSLATGADREEHRQLLASIEEEAETLIGGGLTAAESFPISHLRSIGKDLTCDCLAPHRSAREEG
jgi:hypothetical protein